MKKPGTVVRPDSVHLKLYAASGVRWLSRSMRRNDVKPGAKSLPRPFGVAQCRQADDLLAASFVPVSGVQLIDLKALHITSCVPQAAL